MIRAALALLPLLAVAAAPLQPSQFGDLAFRQRPGAQVPLGEVLRDEAGHPVRLGALMDGRPAVVVLEYLRCPNLCGLVLDGLVRDLAQARLKPGRDLDFIAISIDPAETANDASAARASYMRRFGTGDPAGWHFLTGPAAPVRDIAAAIGFPYRYDPSIRQYAHPAGFVVVTPGGEIARYLLGLDHSPAELRQALAAAGNGEIAPAAHPLFLLCFGYDPQPGTAGFVVLQALRLTGLAAVAACLLLILSALRRERKG